MCLVLDVDFGRLIPVLGLSELRGGMVSDAPCATIDLGRCGLMILKMDFDAVNMFRKFRKSVWHTVSSDEMASPVADGQWRLAFA